MKAYFSFRSLRVFPCVLVGCFLFLLLGCNEFKRLMPKAPPVRKATAADKDPEIQKMLAPEKEPEAEADPSVPRVTSEADRVTGEDFAGASHDLLQTN